MTASASNPDNQVIGSLLASGFPFQTAVANTIKQTEHWSVVSQEFPWSDGSGTSQFLDLVIATKLMIAAVECKKSQKEMLTFLNPGSQPDTTRFRCTYLKQIQDSTKRMERFCTEWQLSPACAESAFCVVSTSESGKDQRMLERDVQRVIHGLDAFSMKHWKEFKPGASEPDKPYLPIIVTNAKLFVANYDAADIDLESGQFKGTPTNITPVSLVRFRKSFSARPDLGARTVFIVSASAFVEFLGVLDWTGSPDDGNKIHFQ